MTAALASAGLAGFACKPAETPLPAPASASAVADATPVVLFLGTSLTAGFGLPAEQAFPALIQERIDASDLAYRVVNAGVSGDTSAGGLRRVDWLVRLPIEVLVLELGANDMLRGLDVDELRENLREIIDRIRDAHPETRLVIAGMRAARNLGPDYVRGFEAVYSQLAREYDAVLIPFALEGVAGVASLNQADGIHPTAEGHRKIAEMFWQALAPVLSGDAER